MTEGVLAFGLAVFVVVFAAAALRWRFQRRQRHGEAKFDTAREQNLHLPLSLHPVIDPNICIGSFSCLDACPEGDILGIADGKPMLVSPSHCIGHGKCAAECPVSAIRLVFGTSERGVDLPEIDEFFESNRAGVHVVGELGGMGLIKNAMSQGFQLAEHFSEKLDRLQMAKAVDVAVVGAGPAGLATAVACKRAGLTCRVLEQDTVGGSVAKYPRQKLLMTEPLQLPYYGKFGKKSVSKEELLETWFTLLERAEIEVEEGVKVVGLDGEDGKFTLLTTQGPVFARKVVLATGRRGSPRKLQVPGEEGRNVAYRLVDPQQYEGCKVLVVGGGDSALEAAIQLAEESNAEVTIAYRGAAFGRTREANRKKLSELVESQRVEALFSTEIREVFPDGVLLETQGKKDLLTCDYVIACLGGELPLELLGQVGVQLKRHFGSTAPEALAKNPVAQKGSARRAADARSHSHFGWTLFGAGAIVILGLWTMGWNYYPLSHAERLRSGLHPFLRPSGPWGHGVGIGATLVLLSNFLYALRKRWLRLKGVWSVRKWLTFHMFVGFMAPLVIAFHAAFQSNNGIATGTAVSLAVVVLTGVVGRFIYGMVPMQDGRVVELSEMKKRVAHLQARLEPVLSGTRRTTTSETVLAEARVFRQIPLQTIRTRLKLRHHRGLFDDQLQYLEFVRVYGKLNRMRMQVAFYRGFKRALAVWRVFHVALAIFLVVMITLHIGVSLYLGYGLDVFR